MNESAASNFINSLVRNLQVLCHSNVEFKNDIEVVGHLYLKVDKAKKFNYIVDEKVCKNDASSTMFVSNSYHSLNTAQKKKDEAEAANKTSSETSDNANSVQSRLNPKADNQTPMSPMSSGPPDIYKTPVKRGMKSPDMLHGRKQPRMMGDGSPHHSFSFSLQRDRESPLKKDRTGSFSASQDSCSSQSFKDSGFGKGESVEIDLTNIKEEVDDKSAVQASCFFGQEQQQQSLDQSSMHAFSNQPKDTSVEEALGLFPVALHPNESQSLDNLSQLSSSVPGSSQGASFSQSSQQMPQFLSVNLLTRGRKELNLKEKVDLIKDSVLNPSTIYLANKYGVARPTVYRILKRKVEYLQLYEEKYDKLRMEMFAPTRSRKELNLEEKIQLIDQFEESNLKTTEKVSLLAEQFGISKSTVYSTLKQKEKYRHQYKEQNLS